jgi:hypothetical protein
MKRTLFFLMVLAAASGIISAQERYITRGATEGELYLQGSWYCNYGFWSDTIYTAILHVTENGKQLEIAHSTLVDDDSPNMQTGRIMADATPGVLYNVDYGEYGNDRLWFSDDYGKTWEVRDEQIGRHPYYISNFEGLIYRGGEGVYKSEDYGNIWQIIRDIKHTMRDECGFDSCELFGVTGSSPEPWILYHTYDWYDTYMGIPIDREFVFGQIGGFFPDVFRGGLPGEVYVTSAFPNNIYKVSFSADMGYHFRVVYHIEGRAAFMSDRKAGEFYIVNGQSIETQQPYGWYTRVCIEHYTDYGETLAGTYCHDLTREGVVTAIVETDNYPSLQVYPNPTGGELLIAICDYPTSDIRLSDIVIYDMIGKRMPIGQSEIGQSEIILNISHLPTGMYFLRITTDKRIITKKIIKK